MINKEKCCGCTACVHVCPKQCIKMEYDNLGFMYPSIVEEACVECNMCEKVCPIINKGEKTDIPFCWGGHAVSEEIRKASSSGGLFSLFAEYVIRDKGVVCGAVLSADCKNVYHSIVENIFDLNLLRGSKYLQSDLKNCYYLVKEYLISGRKVLFSGTPCQIDGLRLFLGKDYDNLLTIEVICHGTPSPVVFREYIDYMEEKLNGKIVSLNFRGEIGGEALIMKMKTNNGRLYQEDKFTDPYFKLFLSNNCLRESCYQCPSRGLYKRSDITIGDFWGVENVAPELVDGGGVSLVMMHTSKGKNAFDSIKDDCSGVIVDFDDAIKGNNAFYESYSRPILRNDLSKDIERMSFERLYHKYAHIRQEKFGRLLEILHFKKMAIGIYNTLFRIFRK